MSTDTNNFTWWQDALAGKHAPIDVNTPQSGFYKVRRRGRDGFAPVAYWWDSKTGELRCHMDGADFNDQRALEIWPYASKAPVSREDYDERLRTGKWPGENEVVIGHNASPPDDSLEALAERLADLGREAEKMIAVGAAQSDATSDQASDLATTLAKLEKKADELRGAEKEPHAEAARAVDRKWVPIRDRAEDLKKRLKAVVVTPWLAKKKQVAEKAAADAIAKGAAPETLPQVRTTAGSQRPIALRTYLRAEVENPAALLDHLKEHPDVVACIQKIANAAALRKIALPGCRVVSEQRAA